jgi:hypothetical protein
MLTLFALASLAAVQGVEPRPSPAPLSATRRAAEITLDGDIGDPGWSQAARIDTFYETVFGDDRAPHVTTVAWVTYDDEAFWFAVRCDDPDPSRIRAPYVDRDLVIGNQDNVALYLDTRNDRRSAQEFRVNPRGIQSDGVFNDANFNEDFSPDFHYQTAARVTPTGWTAEMKIPLSSLRYGGSDPQTWRILVWRNYPRDFRYAIYSSPLPRGSNCYLCHMREIAGFTGLPSSSHLVIAPYASAQDVATASPGDALGDGKTEGQVGVDVKWSPSADMAVDLTVNPDFSQVEGDVAQIAVNNRFALFFPEKRPFFLEGVDLFDSPLQVVYTRTITDPRWGARSTGKMGASSYTVLLTEDAGGGSVILPGPTGSEFAPQDFASYVGIGRWRRDIGASFVGAIATLRDVKGAGHNLVVGPDFQWRRGNNRVTGQFLLTDTRTPERPAARSHGADLAWAHQTRTVDWFVRGRDMGDGFRADLGFIPRVGIHEGFMEAGYSVYREGFFTRLRPYVFVDYVTDRKGDLVDRRVGPGVNFIGRRNLQGFVGANLDRVRTGDRLLSRAQLPFSIQFDPSRRLPRIQLSGFVGEDTDIANVRVGRGGELRLGTNLRPDDHLDIQLDEALSWLDVAATPGASRSRLFTAHVHRVRATWNFDARTFLRLIGQYVAAERDPALYRVAVPGRDRDFSGSALFGYRLNWQSAVYLGYGDERALSPDGSLARTGRQLFAKISYAWLG